ncbi:hypothetical protein PIB30_081450 [Stylosanthes scabra]|uniref:Uncharacterized protein n=1 Tax=Stylosanthes scabra TaxID=79078 RepID=A0ABU6WRI1_9FABA|nr:hypothetical protein [Stylosanthes scabra]
MENKDHVAIELEDMVKNVQPLFQRCTIYKVPDEIRLSNEDAYTPMAVSIGPLHHRKNPKLASMEPQKMIYFRHFIESRSKVRLTDLVSLVRELEPQIRACYSEEIPFTVDEFVKIILVDCCFVIEFFIRQGEFLVPGTTRLTTTIEDDLIFSKPWLRGRITYDLLLLENQLPFFVFHKLYTLVRGSNSSSVITRDYEFHPFFMLISFHLIHFIDPNIHELHSSSWSSSSSPPPHEIVLHFTDMMRFLYLPQSHSHRQPSRKSRELFVHGASELDEVGIKFESRYRSKSVLALEYEYGVLAMPRIWLSEDWSEIVLRNILALEHCHYPTQHYVFDYVDFISQLIDKDKDVDILVENGIINHLLGDNKKVAELFRGLKRNIMVSNCNADYLRISKDLDAYYEDPWHKRLATLKRWKATATIGGIVLLLLTVIQTVFSILQVVL